MKAYLHKILKKLAFRLIAPIALLIMAAGFFMYLFVLTTISDFAAKQIRDSMLETSHDIYNICDSSLTELLEAGLAGDERAVRIKKALTLGMLENFMEANNLTGSVIENDRTTLHIGYIPAEFLEKKRKKRHEVQEVFIFMEAKYGGRKYYISETYFEPWEWHIVLIKDPVIYHEIKDRAVLAYIAAMIILSMLIMHILYYLNRTIEDPVSKLIESMKKGELPEYKGIYEFEFINDSIRNMMIEKQELMKQVIEEQKLKSIRMLAGGVAHNFNNILVGVLGYASLIKIRLEDLKKTNTALKEDSINEVLKYINIIETSAQKAGGLARELLDISRKRTLEKDLITQVDINTLVTEMVCFLENTFPKNIEIKTELSANIAANMANKPPSLVIKGSSSQLEQVLLNICINSKDAMPEGGVLFIETRADRIAEKISKHPFLKLGTYVIVKISDTGIGMDEETLSHIFKPFFTTKSPQGTGLGLASAYSIIKAHSGYIMAESVLNKGSTFTIYLPIE
jgi:signal transduction histidine kinase